MSLPRIAIKRPTATVMFYLGVCLLGAFALVKLPVDLMPDVGSGSLTVFIGVRGGLPPEDIETLVTKVVEEAVATTQHLQNVMSVSRKDRAVSTLTFEPGTDVAFAALEVQERLAKIKNKLPKDIEKPIVAHYSENDYPVIILALSSDAYSPEQLREIVDNTLKPELTRVDGVANIEVGGGRERKILVEFDQSRLDAYQLPIRQVINQLGTNNLNLLTGKMEKDRDSYFLRAMGQYKTMEDMKKLNVAVTKEGSRVLLEDVAEVRDFYLEAQSYARLNKKPTVSVYIQKESQTNTIRVAEKVKAVIDQFKADLDPQINMSVVSDQSIFITEAIETVRGNLTYGAILTGFILFLFLKEIKHTGVIFVSIPISVLMTLGLMYVSKLSLNVMTLSGLALGIGMVVDSSTLVLENILHRKRAALKKDPRADMGEITISATEELHNALITGTLTTVVVFLPIVFINKQVKLLYSGLAYTVSYALLASLIVAITVVPLVASRLAVPAHDDYFSPRVKDILRAFFARLPAPPRWLLRHMPARFNVWAVAIDEESRPPAASLEPAFAYAAAGGGAVPLQERPESPKDDYVTYAAADEGGEAHSAAPQYGEGEEPPPSWKKPVVWLKAFWKTKFLPTFKKNVNGLKHHPARTFRHWCAVSLRKQFMIFSVIATMSILCVLAYIFVLEKEFMGQTEQNEFIIFVELPAGAKLDISDQVVAEVEKVLSELPEISKVVKTAAARVEGWSSKVYVTLVPQGERARSVQDVISTLRPVLSDIGEVYDTFIYFSEPESSKEFLIDVFGHDYGVLRDLAVGIARRLQDVKGLTDIKLRYKPGRPEVKIKIDKERAALFGFTVKDIAETLHAQIRGLRATYFYTANEQIETVARLQERHRKTLEDINFLTLIANDGTIVPLQQVASFEFSLTPSEIWRKDKQRMIQVSANREKLALSTAAERSKASLKGMDVPTGYYHQVGGDYVTMLQNEKEFRFAFIIMAGLVFIVLASMFESYFQPLIVMSTILMALIGAIPLLHYTNTPVTMGVYIGMIMLGGIVVNSAIILVDQMNLSRSQGVSLKRTVLQVSLERLKPILNTSLTTIVGLLPMIWSQSESAQLWAPLALTVVGGLTVATFLTLFVIPALYYHLENYLAARKASV
jgi:hydrophobic/amphiphilic exporter-1 (mainly G- bacteria), HAE1 family